MEVYWHGLSFFIVIVVIIVLIMEIVNYCTLTKVKSELCLLAQSELYDLAPYNYRYGGVGVPRRDCGYRGNQYKYYYGPNRRSCSRRRSSSRRRKSSHKAGQ